MRRSPARSAATTRRRWRGSPARWRSRRRCAAGRSTGCSPPAPTAAPSAAHLVRALAGDRLGPRRVTVTPASAAAVLAAGGQLWLELAGGRRLVELRGIDATAGVVALAAGDRRDVWWWPQL